MFDLDDSDKLKPCPFCGSDVEIVECDEPTNVGGRVVQCLKCLACSRVQFGESICCLLTEAWNLRAYDAQIATLTAKLARVRGLAEGADRYLSSLGPDDEISFWVIEDYFKQILREVGP